MMVRKSLQELFSNEKWQSQLETLSDAIGFALSAYSATGEPILAPRGSNPLCGVFRTQSPGLQTRCDSFCKPFIFNTLQSGKPDVFKCYAKIVNFAFPIRYLDEEAVILGQGSFSGYEDFRDYMDTVNDQGIDMITIKTPFTFTTDKQAWKACRFVQDTVNRLLENAQENIALRKKVESLKSIFSLWSTSSAQGPDDRYRDMLYNLSTLLDIDHIRILVLDRRRGRYIALYGLSKSGVRTDDTGLGRQHPVVRQLEEGKPYVRAPRQAQTTGDLPAVAEEGFFFPIIVNGKLEGILSIGDRTIKEGDLHVISCFCRQTALLIENRQLHQDLRTKLTRFATLVDLTQTIAPIQHYETLLRMILDKSAELLKAEQGSLMLLDQETDDLLLEAKKGIVDGVTEKLRINRGEGIAGKVVERGEAFLVENVEDDPRFNQKNRKHYKTPSFVSVPLKIDDRVIGVINLSDKTTGEVFNEEDLRLIQSFATHAAIIMERNAFQNKAEELKKLTITDPLTGLLNRRYLNERLKDEVARCKRYGHNLTLLMLDLDGFKTCNDALGHTVGDRVLKNIAESLLNTVRSMDVVARYGGDEFVVILPETEEPVAIEIADRLRSSIAHKVPLSASPAGKEHFLTASIGVAGFPMHGDTVELLLENVDKALYRAKNKGKNRIEVFS